MSYVYATQRPRIFTDEGQRLFIVVRDQVQRFLRSAGAFTMGRIFDHASGDSWDIMACVDRLVELGEIEEVQRNNPAGQHRIFTGNPR